MESINDSNIQQTINDYLTPDINQIRHSIRGIDDSYNNAWDIYAELIQNGVDAIRKSANETGSIELEVDCLSRSITITDNGIGIDKTKLPYLLKPFATDKFGDESTIGEKGVGLKFVIFSSNYFQIKTGNNSGAAEAEIIDANNWKKGVDNHILPLIFKPLSEAVKGTQVYVAGVDNDIIFNLTFDQLKYVLRTRTALGTTKKIWGQDKNIDIKIKYKDINSNQFEETIDFRYWLITDNVPANSKISLDDFETWLKSGDRTDQEKTTKLKDKIIYKQGQFTHSNNRIIKYFACFVPQRKVWNELSVSSKLAQKNQLEDDTWLSEYYFTKLNNGIYISVKRMPTGISIDHPTTGYAGYWANLFILFEDPLVRFDIGRKSIHGSQATIHREYAKRIFNEFLQYVTKYVSGDVTIEPTDWDKDEIFDEINRMVDLNINGIKFRKTPFDQEASVAAIFFECIGAGKIQNIVPLICGYRSKYDLYALWDRKKLVIEFKSRLSNLARDFDDTRKMFDEIDCVVCWEVTDKDRQILSDMGVSVTEIEPSLFSSGTRMIPHSTHLMNLSGFTNPIYVIDLKVLLAKQQS